MRVGVDIDGVLADIEAPVLVMLRERYGIELIREDIDRWNYVVEEFDIPAPEYLSMMDEAWAQGDVPLEEPDLSESLRRIKDASNTVTIISKRTRPSHPSVVQWLHDHDLWYDSLVFAWGESKLNYPIDILVDDHTRIVEQAARHPNKTVFLRDQSWNRSVDRFPINAERVNSMRYVAERLEEGSSA